MTEDNPLANDWEPTPENVLEPGDIVKLKETYQPFDSDVEYEFGIVMEIIARYSGGLQQIDSGDIRADMPDLLENAPIPEVGAPRNVSLALFNPGEGEGVELRTKDIGKLHVKHQVPDDGEVSVVPGFVDFHIADLILVMKAGDTYDKVPRDLNVLAYVG